MYNLCPPTGEFHTMRRERPAFFPPLPKEVVMKYRIGSRATGVFLVTADGGRPEQRYATVMFEGSYTAGDAVKKVAEYVEAVRKATKQAKSVRVNGGVSDDS